MLAVVLRQNELVVAEFPEPTPGPGEAVVEVLACGICGSDISFAAHASQIHKLKRNLGDDMSGVYVPDLGRDVFFGHEICGRVSSVGDGWSGPAVGTKVIGVPSVLQGDKLLTAAYNNEGRGGLATSLVLPEAAVIEVPETVASETAALTEPLAVACHAVDRAELAVGDASCAVAVVVGCGPIGLALVGVLHLIGCSLITAIEPVPERRELALRAGASIAIGPEEDMFSVTEHPGSRQHVVFEASGAKGLLRRLMETAPFGSRIVVVGSTLDDDVVPRYASLFRELTIAYAMRYERRHLERAIDMIARGQIDVAEWITSVVDLDGAILAIRKSDDAASQVKVVADPRRSESAHRRT